jgi:hypothetical protein
MLDCYLELFSVGRAVVAEMGSHGPAMGEHFNKKLQAPSNNHGKWKQVGGRWGTRTARQGSQLQTEGLEK